MTADVIIEGIKELPPEQQTRVIQFAIELAQSKQLNADELVELAKKLVESDDPVEKLRLRSAFKRGFYGE
jgi:hypothetical protein